MSAKSYKVLITDIHDNLLSTSYWPSVSVAKWFIRGYLMNCGPRIVYYDIQEV